MSLYPPLDDGYWEPPALSDPGIGELDALLAEAERSGEVFVIPVSPGVIRWLLRGEFHRDGDIARVTGGRIGGMVTGRDFVPYFTEEPLR